MARLVFAHPSRQRLLAWLDTADENPRVTEHVDHCDRCATRIEKLAEHTLPDDRPLAASLGEVLREAYEPPEGINDRVMETLRQRERVDRELAILFGLFSIPKDTADLLLPSETNERPLRDDRDERER